MADGNKNPYEEGKQYMQNAPPEEPKEAPQAKDTTPKNGAPSGASSTSPPPAPSGYVPGEEKKGIAEAVRIIKERRLLRKDMKEKGITNRKDFEIIAESLGLVLWKLNPFFIWLHHALGSLLAGLGLKFLLGATAAGLATVFLVSTITETKGSFTINLTGDMMDAGYVLADNIDFNNTNSRLFADALEEVNNITIDDIALDVDEIDGAHNGEHYFAYTFYIKNGGKKPSSYAWYFKLKDETLNVSDAVWIMLFEDGKQVIYSRPGDDGEAEKVFEFYRPLPFTELAYNPAQYDQIYEDGVPIYGVITTPYANENTVAQGLIENVQPGEVHKYTVVLWVEGTDTDTTNDIFGGYARFEMDFDYIDEDKGSSIFDGVFRTEYEEIPTQEETEGETGEETS